MKNPDSFCSRNALKRRSISRAGKFDLASQLTFVSEYSYQNTISTFEDMLLAYL